MPTFLIFSVLFLSQMALAQQTELHPLCFKTSKSCRLAASIVNTPPYGNFRVSSKCRSKTMKEQKNKVCHNWPGIMAIYAYIDLPQIGNMAWRNHCFRNLNRCNRAAEIWKQFNHPKLSFEVKCSPFVRSFWKINNKMMRKKGIFTCKKPYPTELKIRVKRVR